LDTIFELKQRMLLLERAYAAAGIGHFVLDPDHMMIEFSPWLQEKIGLSDTPVPLDRLSEIIASDERAKFKQALATLIERKRDFGFETKLVTAKGTTQTQWVSGIAAFEKPDTREGLIGYFGVLKEITNQQIAQRTLQEDHNNARVQLAAQTNLLAVVSHEIRTPLGGVLGVIDQLRRERSARERERALTLIEDSCEVLLDTLDSILQQARIGQDSSNLDVRRFRPSSVAHRVAELFRPLARRKGLRIEVKAASQAEAIGDPARLQQVIANFVSNGVKFTQTGAVKICADEPPDEEGKWAFIVSDTGAGIDQKRLASLFQPFGESSADSLGRTVGAGLGLSITRELVNTLGGEIEFDSELGRGSTFTIRVPFERVRAEEGTATDQSAKGRAILLVERASDRVQIEAVAGQFGLETCDFDPEASTDLVEDELLIVIVDAAKLIELPEEILAACDQIFALGNREMDALDQRQLTKDYEAKIREISSNQIARTLAQSLEGSFNDAA